MALRNVPALIAMALMLWAVLGLAALAFVRAVS